MPAIVDWLRAWVVLAQCAAPPAHAAPRLGLVMSGDGALAFNNIGVLQALDEEGARIDTIAATGMSAAVAALRLTGRSPAEIEALAEHLGKAVSQRAPTPYDYPPDVEGWRLLIEPLGP